MPSKADQIRALLRRGTLTNNAIAERIGCSADYVRAVKQRRDGGGLSAADRKWRAGYVEKHGVTYRVMRYRTDEDHREYLLAKNAAWRHARRRSKKSSKSA